MDLKVELNDACHTELYVNPSLPRANDENETEIELVL